MTYTIFFSHAHEDAAIVGAVKELVQNTLDDVKIRSSSSGSTTGGIEPGSDWFDWIRQSIATSDATFVVITVASYNRPWILWEAGAVSGYTLALDAKKLVIPIIYGLPLAALPAPLLQRQAVLGDDASAIRDVLLTLHQTIKRPSQEKFLRLVDTAMQDYLGQVERLLRERSGGEQSAGQPQLYTKTFEGEDLDLNVTNFVARADPEDMSGVAIVNNDGEWIIEIDSESPLRRQRHVAEVLSVLIASPFPACLAI
jgi:TIR domain